jgi:hypothetical protein
MQYSTIVVTMRISITLSPYVARKLSLWGMLHGRTKGVFAAQIISNRVEANIDLINKMLEEEAKNRGISIEELEAILLNEDTKDEIDESK